MSRHALRRPPPELSNHMFGSRDDGDDDDDDDDDVVVSNTSLRSTANRNKSSLNPSHGDSKSLKNSMERDSFLNAFLDRDANLKHEPMPFKSHQESTKKKEVPSPTPTPRPRPRKDVPKLTKDPSADNKNVKEESPKKAEDARADINNILRQSTNKYSTSKQQQNEQKIEQIEQHWESKTKMKSSLTNSFDLKYENSKDQGISLGSKRDSTKSPRSKITDAKIENSLDQGISFGSKRDSTKSPRSKITDAKIENSLDQGISLGSKRDATKSPRSKITDAKIEYSKDQGISLGSKRDSTKSPRSKRTDGISHLQINQSSVKDEDAFSQNLSKFNDLFSGPKHTDRNDKKLEEESKKFDFKQYQREKSTELGVKADDEKKEHPGKHREKSFNNKQYKQEIPPEKHLLDKNKHSLQSQDFEKADLLTKSPRRTPRKNEAVYSTRNQDDVDNIFNMGGRTPSVGRDSRKEDEIDKRKGERGRGHEHRNNIDIDDEGSMRKEKRPEPKKRRDIESRDINSDVLLSKHNSRKIQKDTSDHIVNELNEKHRQVPKQELFRQGRNNDERENKITSGKEYRKADEDIESLFDAGSTRTASVKKEKNKSDKLKEHLRRSNETLRNQLDVEKPNKKIGDQSATSTQKKKGPMKANLTLEQVTKSPTLKKETLTREGSYSAAPLSSKTNRMKSRSLTNISNLASPRSKSPISYDDVSNMDAETLRQQIYADWLQRKNSFTKEHSKISKGKEQNELEEKERSARERRIDAQKSFEAWDAQKKDVLKNKHKENKRKSQEEKEKKDDKLQRTTDSKKFFQSWKERKDEELKGIKSKERKEENAKKKRDMNDKMEKTEGAKKVFDNWKAKKEEVLKEASKEKRKQKKQENEAVLDKLEKKQEAQRSYEAWKEKKEKSRPSSANTLQQRPWCPSSRQRSTDIPENVQPVIVRNKPPSPRTRTLSATARLQNDSSKRSK